MSVTITGTPHSRPKQALKVEGEAPPFGGGLGNAVMKDETMKIVDATERMVAMEVVVVALVAQTTDSSEESLADSDCRLPVDGRVLWRTIHSGTGKGYMLCARELERTWYTTDMEWCCCTLGRCSW